MFHLPPVLHLVVVHIRLAFPRAASFVKLRYFRPAQRAVVHAHFVQDAAKVAIGAGIRVAPK